MKRRLWLGLGLGVAVVVMGHGAIWLLAERRVAQDVAAWQAAAAAQGWRVRTGPPRHAGWPLAATRVYPDVTISGGPIALGTAALAVSVSPLHGGTARITFPAPVDVALRGAFPLQVAAPEGTLDLPLRGPPYLQFDTRTLRVAADQPGGPPRIVTVGVSHLRLDPAASATSITLSMQSIALPEPRPGEILPLGPRLASLSFDAAMHGSLDLARLDAASLTAWRDAGGALDISRLALGYGPLGLSAQGRFALDGDLQPAGQATLTIVGYAATLQALSATHVLTASMARAIGAVMTLLAHAPDGGGAPLVDTTLAVRHQVVSIAGFPLARLPPLLWPDGS